MPPSVNPYILIHVADTGIGMPKKNLDSIFEFFPQGEHASFRKSEGVGLGLAISRSILEQLGGEIHVKSRQGKGSTFTISLPVTEPDNPNRDSGPRGRQKAASAS